MSAPISADIHNLLIRPTNSSLVLGAAHHVLYRPANAAVSRLFGKGLHKALDPAEWGAAAARAGEKIDRSLSVGGHRVEKVTLNSQHLRDIGSHLDDLVKKDPRAAQDLEGRLNSVVANHYNNNETIKGLVGKAHQNDQFAATLHGVKVPSLTGEVGKSVKNVATDIAAIYGAGEIMNKVRDASESAQEKKGSEMTMIDDAIEALLKAASILEQLPVKERAVKMATQLLDADVIKSSEVEKYASIFESNPADAETIFSGMIRGKDSTTKSASLGEPIVGDVGSGGKGSFEDLCREGFSGSSLK